MALVERFRKALASRVAATLAPLVDDAVGAELRRAVEPAIRSAIGQTIDTQWRRYLALAMLASRAESPATLGAAECRVFSQNGEDGVLHALLQQVPATPFFVEFGAGQGVEGNCVLLADVFGWQGLFAEASASHFGHLERKYEGVSAVRSVCTAVTAANVNDVFAANGVPADFGILSIDVDGQDYWIWQALSGYRPAIVVIEYNASYPSDVRHLPEPSEVAWRGEPGFGASLRALFELGQTKGYELVHTDLTGVNAFFVREDLVGGLPCGEDIPWRRANYFFQWQGFDGPGPEYIERD